MLQFLGIGVVLVLLLFFAALDVYWPIGAAIFLAGAIGVFFFSFPIWAWILANPLLIFAYFAIGLPWLFFRWTRFVEVQFKAAKKNIAERDWDASRWERLVPKWSDHKWQFAPYYCYWPVDIIVYLLTDILNDIWKLVSRMVSEAFDRYSRWRFSHLGGA